MKLSATKKEFLKTCFLKVHIFIFSQHMCSQVKSNIWWCGCVVDTWWCRSRTHVVRSDWSGSWVIRVVAGGRSWQRREGFFMTWPRSKVWHHGRKTHWQRLFHWWRSSWNKKLSSSRNSIKQWMLIMSRADDELGAVTPSVLRNYNVNPGNQGDAWHQHSHLTLHSETWW